MGDNIIKQDELKKLNHKLKENNTVLNLFVKDQDHTIETKCDEIESLRGTATQLARAVIEAHKPVIYLWGIETSILCQCDDCKLAREVVSREE